MSHPLEKVRLGIDDPSCRGVTSSNGRVRFDARDHVVEVPRIEAEKLLGHGMVSKMNPTLATNRPVLESHKAYDEYCESHGFMPYMQWYREVWKGA